MADIVTRRELEDAKIDAKDLGEAVNEKVIVSPRYGEDFKSLPMLAAEAQGSINEWGEAIQLITVNDGVPALAVSDASGKTQQEINDYVGAKWRNKAGGYALNARAVLENGDIVKSTVANNTVNPNTDMTGWVKVNSASQIFDSSGNSLQSFSDRWVDITNLLISGDTTAAKAWNKTVFDNAAIKAKAESKGVYCAPRSSISMGADIDLLGITDIYLAVDIKNPSNTLFVGGQANTGKPFDVYLQAVHNGTSTLTGAIPSIPTIMLSGVKGGNVFIGNTNLCVIHAVGGSTTRGSNAYFDMFIGGVIRAFRVSDEGVYGWNTRINVRGGRIVDLDVTGTGYVPNELLFDSNTFEGTNFRMRFDNASCNRVINARFEGTESSAGITFTTTARANTVVQRWSGSGSNRSQFKPYPPVVDNGSGNSVTTNSLAEFNKTNLFSVGLNSEIIANASDSSSPDPRTCRTNQHRPAKQLLKPNLNNIEFVQGRFIALSNMIPVQKGDVINFDCSYSGALLRPQVYIYDADKKLITSGEGHIGLIGGVFDATNGAYGVGANLTAEALSYGFDIMSPNVKYIEVGLYSTVAGSFKHVSCNLYTQAYGRSFSEDAGSCPTNLPTINGAPVYGLPSVGRKIYDSSQSKILTCAAVVRTRSTSASNSVNPSLASYNGISNGMLFSCIQVDGSTKWTTITSSTGSSITLAESVNVAENSLCVAVRWESITFA